MKNNLTIALPKGRVADNVLSLFTKLFQETFVPQKRKLTLEVHGFKFLFVRSQDVPTYVQMGAADLGVCGLDVLTERQTPVTRLLDLQIGKCEVVLGMQKGKTLDLDTPHITVATKMTNIARTFFDQKAMSVTIVKLYGSIELAPIVGLADAIVDITETGTTMKENGLTPVETILKSSVYLFANQNSYIQKKHQILDLTDKLQKLL